MFAFSVIPQVPVDATLRSTGLVWRTCVREVALVEQRSSIPQGVPALHDEAAYAHLLGVICGLDSPMVGETEVMHQFKIFAASVPADQPLFRDLCQSLLADARQVRSQYLLGLGSRTYGSAVRRLVHNSGRIAMIGTGMLASEILPFVTSTHLVDVWGRRESFDTRSPAASYRRFDTELSADERTAIVVAAPVESRIVRSVAQRYRNIDLLIDLRAEGVQDPPPPVAPIVTLADVFAGVAETSRAVDARVAAARDEIRQRAQAYAARAKLNPSGWHDLCA